MIITKAMWEKTLSNHKQNLDRVQKRNDPDDKFIIETYKRSIAEIELLLKNRN